MYVFNKDHNINTELDEVHNRMIAKYNLKRKATSDVARAKQMEGYLRMFKALGNQRDDKIMPSFQNELESEAMKQIALDVGAALGINSYSLFRNQHKWYLDSQTRWGADDVFEAELSALLNVALERASINKTATINAGSTLVGNIAGNISQEFLQLMSENGQRIISSTSMPSKLINTPQFRAGKVDVTGYKGNFDITADIDSQWQNFIRIFSGAKFTVKNYSSTSSSEVIHLGRSNIMKSILGELDELNYPIRNALHIYYHSINSYNKKKTKTVGHHILHLRFAYELSGGGLYDSQGNRLDAADFFIYNDPSSNNIWVRSTKDMIANAMDYLDSSIGNPITSGVVILKQSFV